MDDFSLKEKWAVVKEDWHYRKVYVPFHDGRYTASEQEAKARAEELQKQTHTENHHHKVSFSAEVYDPNDSFEYG